MPLAVGPAITIRGGASAGMAWMLVLMAGAHEVLDDGTVARIAAGFNAGTPRRLGPDACELPVGGPDTIPEADGLDWAVLPAEGRRKHLLVADMDSTVLIGETLDELAAEAGLGPRVAAITARAMNGEVDFEAAVRERVGLLAGLGTDAVGRVLARVRPTSGAAELVATMRASGAHTMLVTGGFDVFARDVARRLGFGEFRSNILGIAEGRLTGRVVGSVLGREAKQKALMDGCLRYGLVPRDAVAVGDGANDLGMLGVAGLGVAFRAKPGVAAAARVRVNRADLTGLLYLQGYARDEFVRAD